MKFVPKKSLEINYRAIDSWNEAGFLHGFLGADLNVNASKETAETFLASLINKEKAELFLLDQVHADRIISVTTEDLGNLRQEMFQADAWAIDPMSLIEKDLFFGIKSADCYPVIIYCPQTKLAANLHCGWRGTVEGLLIKAVKELLKKGATVENLEIAIGPGAGVCCYQVGEEVIAAVRKLDYLNSKNVAEILLEKGNKVYCNIEKLLLLQTEFIGITKRVASSLCTICNQNFFSYRRQKEQAGRQLSFISRDLYSK